jgi:hypothetical protein
MTIMPAAIAICPACHHRRLPRITQACRRCSSQTTHSATAGTSASQPGRSGIPVAIDVIMPARLLLSRRQSCGYDPVQ